MFLKNFYHVILFPPTPSDIQPPTFMSRINWEPETLSNVRPVFILSCFHVFY